MKDYFADPQVSTALALIDWGTRYVNLGVKSADATVKHRLDETLVDRLLQCSALRPHTMLSTTSDAVSVSAVGTGSEATLQPGAASSSDAMLSNAIPPSSDQVSPSDATSSPATPTSGGAAFGAEEAAIRDCYDRFLDGLDRYGNYLTGKLVSTADLQPYLGYWITDIASTQCDEDDALWSVCLFAYIEFYAFLGVRALFAEFGYRIGIDGDLVNGFLGQLSDPEKKAKAETVIKHVKAAKQPQVQHQKP
jgi:hypothetical protein